MDDFYSLKSGRIWAAFKADHPSFWTLCAYLFFEYVRPQSIFPVIDFLPWAKLFLILSLLLHALSKEKRWTSDPANKWLLTFLVIITLSSMLAVYPEESWRNYEKYYLWVIIYFLIVNIVNTPSRFYVFLGIFLTATFKISFGVTRVWVSRGFSFASWGLEGPPGYFQNSGELAVQMLMFAPLAYCLALFCWRRVGRLKRWILVLMPLTGVMAIIGASSRGGQLGLALQVCIIFFRDKFHAKRIVAALLLVAIGYWLLPQEQLDRFSTAGKDTTSEQRLLYWKHGREIIQEYPALGIGFFNFPRFYEDRFKEDLFFKHAQLPHNIFIQVGTDTGISGLLVYGVLIWRVFATTRRIRQIVSKGTDASSSLALPLSRAFDVAFVGFLVAGQFVSIAYYPFMWIQLAMVVAMRNSMEQASSSHRTHARGT